MRVIAGMAETARLIQPKGGLIEPRIKASPEYPGAAAVTLPFIAGEEVLLTVW